MTKVLEKLRSAAEKKAACFAATANGGSVGGTIDGDEAVNESAADSGVENFLAMPRNPTVAVTNDVDPPLADAAGETDTQNGSVSISLSLTAKSLLVPRSTVVNGGGASSSFTGEVTATVVHQHAQPAFALGRRSPVLQRLEHGEVIAEAVSPSPSSSGAPPIVAIANNVDPPSAAAGETDAENGSVSISLPSTANSLLVPRLTVVNGGGAKSSFTGDKVTALVEQAQPALALGRRSPVLQQLEHGEAIASEAVSPSSSGAPPIVAVANNVIPPSAAASETDAAENESVSISLPSTANSLLVPRSTGVFNGEGASPITDKVTALVEQAQPAVDFHVTTEEQPVLTATSTNGSHDPENIKVGDIGYRFRKEFGLHGWFIGEVIEIYQKVAGKFEVVMGEKYPHASHRHRSLLLPFSPSTRAS